MKTPMKWLPALVAVGLVVAKASTSVLNDATANDSQSAAPLVALATPSPSPAATASNPQPSTGAIPSPQSPS
ncbi:MAG: hypothetical protein ACR2PL_00905, partial [Dehalococcoidia bacterium]